MGSSPSGTTDHDPDVRHSSSLPEITSPQQQQPGRKWRQSPVADAHEKPQITRAQLDRLVGPPLHVIQVANTRPPRDGATPSCLTPPSQWSRGSPGEGNDKTGPRPGAASQVDGRELNWRCTIAPAAVGVLANWERRGRRGAATPASVPPTSAGCAPPLSLLRCQHRCGSALQRRAPRLLGGLPDGCW